MSSLDSGLVKISHAHALPAAVTTYEVCSYREGSNFEAI